MSHLKTVVGAFASPIASNPTRPMMEAAFESLELDWLYVNCEVGLEQLPGAVNGALSMGWRGFNLSLPNKVAVLPLLTRLRSAAELTQSVNVVSIEGLGLVGDNTDGQGFVASLPDSGCVEGEAVAILGAGGAARAIAVACAQAGARHIHLLARNEDAIRDLAELVDRATGGATTVQGHRWAPSLEVPAGCGLLVNATPIGSEGMRDEMPDSVIGSLANGAIVADVTVDAPTTPLLDAARECGARPIDGRAMLVEQAALNLEFWSGGTPDRGVMRAALDRALSSVTPRGGSAGRRGKGRS